MKKTQTEVGAMSVGAYGPPAAVVSVIPIFSAEELKASYRALDRFLKSIERAHKATAKSKQRF